MTEKYELTTDQAEREASGAHRYGRYLEEFEVGAVYKHWPAKTVTEADDLATGFGEGDGQRQAHVAEADDPDLHREESR